MNKDAGAAGKPDTELPGEVWPPPIQHQNNKMPYTLAEKCKRTLGFSEPWSSTAFLAFFLFDAIHKYYEHHVAGAMVFGFVSIVWLWVCLRKWKAYLTGPH